MKAIKKQFWKFEVNRTKTDWFSEKKNLFFVLVFELIHEKLTLFRRVKINKNRKSIDILNLLT